MKLMDEHRAVLDKVNSVMKGWDAGYAAGKRAGALAMRERGTLLFTGTTGEPQLTPLGQTIERLERELAEARQDARRYRWLRVNPVTFKSGVYVAWKPDELDAAIDAAMVENDER